MWFESKEALAAYFLDHPDLKHLKLNSCTGITSLPPLPGSLTDLTVYNCPGITKLPALPRSLTGLRTSGKRQDFAREGSGLRSRCAFFTAPFCSF